MGGKRIARLLCGIVLFTGVSVFAGDGALLRLEKEGPEDRILLLKAGVPLVHEFETGFLALDDGGEAAALLTSLDRRFELVEPSTAGWTYYAVRFRAGGDAGSLAGCGDIIWREEEWALLRTPGEIGEACVGSPLWSLHRLELAPLALPKPPPEEFEKLQEGSREPLAVNPNVQAMVAATTSGVVVTNWKNVISGVSPTYTTRYSTSPGCQSATTQVYNKFSGFGVSPVYQNHTSGHAPNVVGTITGKVSPEKVYIAIGHIDDMPGSGSAPGADDNASGASMVVTCAQILAPYSFTSTVKFLVVTGEEFGYYGSEYYVNQAVASGEQIQGVLNADMIAWQGDGAPIPENLDLPYNTSSAWLGQLMAQCSVDYATGGVVDTYNCYSDGSDHIPFWEHGFSAVMGITDDFGACGHVGENPNYHSSSDTEANCGSTTFLVNQVKNFVATLAHMANPLCANPSAPTNPSAASSGANKITVSWTTAGSGLTYEVYRARGDCSGTPSYSKIGESTTGSYLDATVSGGVTYAYRVNSKREVCTSSPTACVQASTTGSCLEAPTFAGLASVTSPANATCQLSLAWSAGTAWCGGPVRYNVYRSTSSGFTPVPANRIVSSFSGTTYTDLSGLVTGTRYYYVVRAVDLTSGTEDANAITKDGVPAGAASYGTWSDDAGDTGTAKMVLASPWSVAASGGHTSPKVYATGTTANDLCAALTTPALTLGTGAALSFESKYDLEAGYDAGILEVATGPTFGTWTKLAVTTYPDSLSHTGNACGFATSGANTVFSRTNSTPAYASGPYTASLSAYNGQEVKVRWRVSTDGGVNGSGWWVDDISITNVGVPGSCSTASPPGEVDAGGTPGTSQGWSGKAMTTWHSTPLATSYRLYRGTLAQLPKLLSGGLSACARYEGGSLSASVAEDPGSVTGRVYWYLVTGVNAAGEGTAGAAAGGTRVVSSTGTCP